MPQEEKPTFIELETARAYGFHALRYCNKDRDTHYVRVTRHKRSGRLVIEMVPDDQLDRVKPVPKDSTVSAWWDDEHTAQRIRDYAVHGEWSKVRRFHSSKGRMVLQK